MFFITIKLHCHILGRPNMTNWSLKTSFTIKSMINLYKKYLIIKYYVYEIEQN